MPALSPKLFMGDFCHQCGILSWVENNHWQSARAQVRGIVAGKTIVDRTGMVIDEGEGALGCQVEGHEASTVWWIKTEEPRP